MANLSYYEILKIDSTATADEIKEAYRSLSMVWHPDRFKQGTKTAEMASQEMKVLNQAYEVLRDADRRAEYDRMLRYTSGRPPKAEPPPPPPKNPKYGTEMLLIPAGNFIMGSKEYDNEKFSNKGSQSVYLDAYYIYKYEVTVVQYLAFCDATRRGIPEAPYFNKDWENTDHPIVNVSWDDAQAYCEWAGGSLPTEAQWEKAARGTDGRKYPWGNDWNSSKCQCSPKKWSGGKNTPVAVGNYYSGISPYGVMDMAGNVWEWCADWYEENYYGTAPNSNPSGPVSGASRVLRGGSWYNSNPNNFRCSGRHKDYPTYRDYTVGFRCVLRSDS